MKKLSILCFLLANFLGASATHIVGGSISYEHISDNQYKIRLEVLRDCYGGNPNAYFDNPAAVGIFDPSGILVDTLFFSITGIDDTISLDVQNSICSFPESICIHRIIYEGNVILTPSMDGYLLAYQRCCRTGSLANIVDPLNSGMTFHTTIDLAYENTSPVFNSEIPFAVFSETAFVYDGSAIDPDGDSLVYELSKPFLGASPDFPLPQPPNPPPYDPVNFILPTYSVQNMLGGNYPLTINSKTGEMVAIPSFLGVFQIGYLVKEYRNGILIGSTQREFIFYVTPFDEGLFYTVKGAVLLENSMPLDAGTVQILERNVSNDSLFVFAEQSINANGRYSFQNIPPGVFYVKALIDPNSIYFDEYLPTYYNDATFWYTADPINQCDTSDQYRDIYLIPAPVLLGNIIFDGNVFAIDSGDPVANLSLLLTNEAGTFVQSRVTDATGYFKFENLTAGSYQIHGDLTNSTLLNEFLPSIEIPQANPVTLNLFDDRLSFDTTIEVDELTKKEAYEFRLFPNPTSTNIHLNINLNQADLLNINLYNTQGVLINQRLESEAVSTGEFSASINLENHPAGIYFLEIQGKEGSVFRKVLKRD